VVDMVASAMAAGSRGGEGRHDSDMKINWSSKRRRQDETFTRRVRKSCREEELTVFSMSVLDLVNERGYAGPETVL
jgi:hypothetical protein